MIAASDFKIQRGVIIAPFTSTMDMTREVLGIPLGFLVWHRFDNEARLSEMEARGPGEIIIFHGVNDEVIPIRMSRKLASEHKDLVRLIEVPGGRHNTVQGTSATEITKALRECGGDHRSPR